VTRTRCLRPKAHKLQTNVMDFSQRSLPCSHTPGRHRLRSPAPTPNSDAIDAGQRRGLLKSIALICGPPSARSTNRSFREGTYTPLSPSHHPLAPVIALHAPRTTWRTKARAHIKTVARAPKLILAIVVRLDGAVGPLEAIAARLERVESIVLEAIAAASGFVGADLAALAVRVGPVLHALAVDVAGGGLAVGRESGSSGQDGAGEVEREVHACLGCGCCCKFA